MRRPEHCLAGVGDEAFNKFEAKVIKQRRKSHGGDQDFLRAHLASARFVKMQISTDI